MTKTAKHNGRPAQGHAFQDLSTETVGAIKQIVQEVRDETLELVQAARDEAGELSSVAHQRIRKYPFRAVGIALGAGCLLGFLLARK